MVEANPCEGPPQVDQQQKRVSDYNSINEYGSKNDGSEFQAQVNRMKDAGQVAMSSQRDVV